MGTLVVAPGAQPLANSARSTVWGGWTSLHRPNLLESNRTPTHRKRSLGQRGLWWLVTCDANSVKLTATSLAQKQLEWLALPRRRSVQHPTVHGTRGQQDSRLHFRSRERRISQMANHPELCSHCVPPHSLHLDPSVRAPSNCDNLMGPTGSDPPQK